MDLKEFTQNFMEGIDASVEFENADRLEELTSSFLEYIEDTGEIGFPQICSFKKTGAAIHAYDYNDENNSLDLFLFYEPENLLGKVNDSKISDCLNRMMRFYNECLDGTIEKSNVEKNDEIMEVVELIKSTKGKIDTLRLYVLTTGLNDTFEPYNDEIDDGYIYSQNVWDMQRVYQQYKIRSGKEKVEIDFPAVYNTELQCLKMNNGNPDVDAYLAIIPGVTLAKIYNTYQQTLLEKNVRTFLQFKSKVNRNIRTTLKETPDMFFSYNNGISTTASRILTKEIDGALYITHLFDWQIVNGGQTTASIAAISKERGVDLSKVFVPMKISVIADDEKSRAIVPNISLCANSQTAVKDSDFSANDPYLVKLEEFSRSIWVPNDNSKATTKWYFERTRGQYLDELSPLTGQNEKMFKLQYPKSHKLTKTDIAKYLTCWDQRPDLVCKGAEKNYKLFVENIKKNRIEIGETYYKRLIAKAILFNEIDKYVKSQQLGGYKSNMNNYILASISAISKKNLDLDYIWKKQSLQPEVQQMIVALTPLVWKHLTESSPTSAAQGANVNEWSKKLECWNSLKPVLFEFNEIPTSILLSSEAEQEVIVTPAQIEIIEKAWAIKADVWFALSKWAKEHGELTPLDRKMAYSFGQYKSWNRKMSLKQANAGLKMLDKAKDKGFVEE